MPHYVQLPSGHWRAIVQHDGQKRTATAPTKPEAQRLAAQMVLDMGGTVGRRGLTVGDLLATAVTERGPQWSPTYADDVDRVINRLPDAFTARAVRSVTPSTISGLYRQLAGDGWSPWRVRRAHEVLSAAWAEGLRLELVAGQPFQSVRKPAVKPRTMTVPTDDQVRQILATSGDSELLALRVAATLGIRRGEIVALQWDDVDVERATVVIRRSLAYTPKTAVFERDTKTGRRSHRVLALPLPVVAMLRRHRRHQAALALAAGIQPRWIFSYDAGHTPWRPDRLTHLFSQIRAELDMPGIRLHDLRHYVATTMLQDGEPLIDVANQLGHTTPATTSAVYAHMMPGRGRESVNRRDARLGG